MKLYQCCGLLLVVGMLLLNGCCRACCGTHDNCCPLLFRGFGCCNNNNSCCDYDSCDSCGGCAGGGDLREGTFYSEPAHETYHQESIPELEDDQVLPYPSAQSRPYYKGSRSR